MTIGERAALEIQEQALVKHIKLGKELENIGSNRKNYRLWKSGVINPQAFFLQQMALAGYDIYWILTGKGKEDGCEV